MTAPRYRLDGNTRLDARKTPGWPTLRPPTLEAPPGGPLTLLPISEGRLSLESTDGTMGSLRLPPWLAVGPRGEVRLLHGGRIYALHPPGDFAPLTLPRLPASPRAVHATEYLYVLGRDELLVFDATLRVVAQIGGLGDVIDTTPEGGGLLLLRDNGQLDRLAPATHGFETLPPLEPGDGYRRVIALTSGGRALLTDRGDAVVVDDGNRLIERVKTAGALRKRVAPPPVRLDDRGRFALPPELLTACPVLGPVPPLDDPLGARLAGGRIFEPTGAHVEADPSTFATAPVLERTGWWMSDRLDGGRDGQIWRTGLLRLSALPPGTQVRLEALTSDNPDALPETQNLDILKDLFRVSLEHREPAQRPPGDDDPTRLDFHVAAPPGRYIWLRLVLSSDGRRTPAIEAMEVVFGGERKLDLLPAEFQQQEPMRDFLERLFGLLDTGTAQVENVLARRDHLLDPRLTSPSLLSAIETWLGMIPDPRLDPAARRRLLWLRIQQTGSRGTRAGLRHRVSALLAALSGLKAAHVEELVRIVEGFQTRTSLRLGNGGRTLGSRAALSISSGIALGRDVLDSRTDPAISDFQRTANRAEVVVPMALVPDDTQADMLARAIAEEVPAHVAVTITRDPGGIRLGDSVRLGLGTLLLDPRDIRLGCYGRGPTGAARLGIDARLSSAGVPPAAIRLDRNTHRGGAARLP